MQDRERSEAGGTDSGPFRERGVPAYGFLPAVVSIYWRLPARRAQNVLLLVASYIFYGWWDARFCFLILFSSLVDFWVGRSIHRSQHKKAWLCISLATNLGLLGFFKYCNFFIENFVALMTSLGLHADPWTLKVILPVGISFYTFQTLSYTIDIYRGRLKPTDSLLDFLTFVAFFPQLVAGPIERARSLLPQFENDRKFDQELATDGCRQILWGFVKKVAIADNLARIVDTVYADAAHAPGPSLVFATVCFAFQIYCDFSGYSDIAIGVAKLLGIDLMRNFAYPYFSQSVGEFWRRWHISLSTWFRDYVYIPLGGSRGGKAQQAWAVLVTFVVSGLWHGPSWNFVAWGAWNGVGILPEILQRKPTKIKGSDVPGPTSAGGWLRMLGTFVFICWSWIFFRAAHMTEALGIMSTIFVDLFDWPKWQKLASVVFGSDLLLTSLAIPTLLVIEWWRRSEHHPLNLESWPRWARWLLYTLLSWGTLAVMRQESGPFIYFQF